MIKRIQIRKIIWFAFLLLLVLKISSLSFAAEGDILWIKLYDGGDDDNAYSVTTDSNDNIIVTGYSKVGTNYNYLTIKYDPNGNVLWTKSYDGGGYDFAEGVATDSSNNVIVTGYSAMGTSYNYYTIKYDPTGNVLWNRDYDGGDNDTARDVTTDYNNNVIVTGGIYNGRYHNYYTIKYDPNGNVLWSKSYDNGRGAHATGVATDSNNNIIITGGIYIGTHNNNYYTIKYDPNGNVLWSKSYDGGMDDLATSIATDSNNNIIVTGYSEFGGPYEYGYYTIKYDPNGNVLWSKSYDGGYADYARDVITDSDDNIIVTGSIYDGNNNCYYTIKYDPNGNVLWAKSYPKVGRPSDAGVTTDSNNNIIITGKSVGETGFDYDFCTIKYEGPSIIKTITGAIHYENKIFNETGAGDPNAIELKPVRFAKIEIIRDSDGTVLGTADTKEDGTYSIEIRTFINDKVYLKCYANQENADYNIAVRSFESGNPIHFIKSDTKTVTADNLTVDLDITEASGEGGAFNILDTLMQGSDKVKGLSGSVPLLVTVYWQKEMTSGTYYQNNAIYLNGSSDDPDEYDDAVVLHEYGHFIAEKYSYDKSPGGNHQANDTNQDIRLSWSEGWATFLQGLCRNNSVYVDICKEDGQWIANTLNIETLFHSYYGSLLTIATGQDTEIAVSAILWDIFDNPIGDDDSLGLGAQYNWNVFDNYITSDMDCVLEDFYNGWFSQNGTDFYKNEINSIFSSRFVFYSTSDFVRGPTFTKFDGNPIPDGTGESLNSLLNITDNLSIRNINVFVDLPHKYRTDLLVTLISPSDKEVILHNHTGPLSGQPQDIFAWYHPPYETIPAESLDRFKGENSQGNWTLKITDPTNHELMEDDGMLNRWKIEIIPKSPADFDCDGDVDWADLAVFMASWLRRRGEPGYDPRCDFNNDGIVNFRDYAVFANEWNPHPPSNLNAQAVSPHQINLSWQDNTDGESGFKIERKLSAEGGTYGQIATVGQDATGYSDTGLAVEQTYYYRVCAYGTTFAASGYSNEANASTELNHPPVLDPIGNRTVNEGQLLQFSISATDPNGDTLTYSAQNLPAGATFTDQAFSWTPTLEQAGTYPVTFTVSDGQLNDSETINIEVYGKPLMRFIFPRSGAPGSYLRILGKDFGSRNASSRVQFSSLGGSKQTQKYAQLILWNKNYIICRVPEIKPGIYKLTVINQAGKSNPTFFIVRPKMKR